MGSLILNFIKRAFLAPILVTVLVIIGVISFVPRYITESRTAVSQSEGIDTSAYTTTNYEKLSELKSENYVGYISSEDFDMGQTAVIYNSSVKSDAYVEKGSVEPWNGSKIVLRGSNSYNQLKQFHNAKKGDKILFDFFSNDEYTYKIKRIVTGLTESDIETMKKDSQLMICLPYNDFTNIGDAYLYTVYFAELTK